MRQRGQLIGRWYRGQRCVRGSRQACRGPTVPEAFEVVYKEPNEGGVVLSLGLALPAGFAFRGCCTTVNTLSIGTSPSSLEMVPKVECPNHKSLLQYLSSN